MIDCLSVWVLVLVTSQTERIALKYSEDGKSALYTVMGRSSLHLAIVWTLILSFTMFIAASFKVNPVILISLDGLAWQVIVDKLANTPNFYYIARTGVKSKCIRTVTPSLTWPNHHTYMTGLYPESHGIVSNVFYDPLYDEWFIYEGDCSSFDPKFYNDSEPIWLTLQRQGGTSGVYFWPGSGGYEERPRFFAKPICNVNCQSRDRDLSVAMNTSHSRRCIFNYSEPWHSRIDQIVRWLTSEEPPRFVAIYFEEPDLQGHSFGVHSREYLNEIERVDREAVGYLLERLRHSNLLDEVNLMFVTDHGISNVSVVRQIYLDDYVDPSLYFLSQAGTSAHVWPFEGKFQEVYEALTRIKHGRIKIHKKEDIPDILHWKNNRRIPPIFVEPDLGWQVFQSVPESPPSGIPQVYGAHGWPSVHREMWSIFFARGPAFRQGVEMGEFETVDLYPMMCHLLGINPRPNNGSLINVKEMLKETHNSEGRFLTPCCNLGFLLTVLLIIIGTSRTPTI